MELGTLSKDRWLVETCSKSIVGYLREAKTMAPLVVPRRMNPSFSEGLLSHDWTTATLAVLRLILAKPMLDP